VMPNPADAGFTVDPAALDDLRAKIRARLVALVSK
jgi:hypothetical protein